jgi:hypothetical protein
LTFNSQGWQIRPLEVKSTEFDEFMKNVEKAYKMHKIIVNKSLDDSNFSMEFGNNLYADSKGVYIISRASNSNYLIRNEEEYNKLTQIKEKAAFVQGLVAGIECL